MYTKSNHKKIRTFLSKHVNLPHPSNCNSPKVTAHFPRKKHYRATWKSAKNVQGTHPHYIANPKGSEVNQELAERTKEFSLSGFPDTIMLKHWLEQQGLRQHSRELAWCPIFGSSLIFWGGEYKLSNATFLRLYREASFRLLNCHLLEPTVYCRL